MIFSSVEEIEKAGGRQQLVVGLVIEKDATYFAWAAW